jgi:two-component system, OmpR family, sensor histidine kinase TctE
MAAPRSSLRRYLLLGILLPIAVFLLIDTWSLHRQALAALNTAYDRTLLASAKTIGEQLEVVGVGEQARVRATVPFSALEAFEADSRSRMYYRVSGFSGELVSGYEDLPPTRDPQSLQPNPYAALVNFYNDSYQGREVRVAQLLQPVASASANGMATVQVMETLELRQSLARQILLDTLLRQILLVAVIAAVVVLVVQRATEPVRRLSAQIEARAEDDLQPLPAQDAPAELLPLVDATNHALSRVEQLLDHQKRFVRDAAHQLRTPLAVLKTQVQSAQRGDISAQQAIEEIAQTTERATELANQMLSLAKVEQLRQQGQASVIDWAESVRAVALDLGVLIAAKNLDFELRTAPASVRAHEWMLRELTRNLLHNAIGHSPKGAPLSVVLQIHGAHAQLHIEDAGPGIDAAVRERLFAPFSTHSNASIGAGSAGLGLTIAKEITTALGGQIDLRNRQSPAASAGMVCAGLIASVQLPLNTNHA